MVFNLYIHFHETQKISILNYLRYIIKFNALRLFQEKLQAMRTCKVNKNPLLPRSQTMRLKEESERQHHIR